MTSIRAMNSVSGTTYASLEQLWRKHMLTALLAILAWSTVTLAAAEAPTPARQAGVADARVVTMTYLKSAPGKLNQLERYIRANWFAMDEIAVKRGLFVSYLWLDTGSDKGPWNAIVMVTYRDVKGFAGISKEWSEIKAAHREVLIDGARQADLGRVVESREFFEREPFVNVAAPGTPRGGAEADSNSPD